VVFRQVPERDLEGQGGNIGPCFTNLSAVAAKYSAIFPASPARLPPDALPCQTSNSGNLQPMAQFKQPWKSHEYVIIENETTRNC